MLRTEDRTQACAWMRGEPIDNVDELVIHRGWIADYAHVLTVEPRGGEQPFGSQRNSHNGIIAYEMREHGSLAP